MAGPQPRFALAGLAALVLARAHRSWDGQLDISTANTTQLERLIQVRDWEIEELERKLEKARHQRRNKRSDSLPTHSTPVGQTTLHAGPRMLAPGREAGSEEEEEEAQQRRGMVPQEDLTSDALLEILELHDDSEFWMTTVDALADQLTAGRSSGPSSFAELGATERAALAQEHGLVQKAVARVRGIGTDRGGWFRGNKDLVKCAQDVTVLGDGTGKTQQEVVVQAQKELLPGRLSNTGEMQNQESEESPIQLALKESWALVKRDFQDMAYFFTHFVRWEVYVNIVGSPLSFGIPLIGWKCQPLMMCLKEIVMLPVKFLKLVASIIYGIARVILGLLQGLLRWLGGSSSANGAPRDSTAADVDVPVQSPPGQNGELPSREKVLETVKAAHSQLFDEYQLYKGKCAGCGARLKGLFDIAPLEILKTVVSGGLLGVIKIFVTTIPVPMAKYVGCTNCLWKWREDLNYMFYGSSAGDTARYWAAGQCNAHTMGMCMMLEKVRMCGHRLHYTKDTIDQKAGDTWVSSNQIKFCEVFKGVNLKLTKMGGHVRCPTVVRDRVFRTEGKILTFNEDDMTGVSFYDGCNMVRQTLKDYNTRCKERAPATSMFSRLWEDYRPEPDVGNSSSAAQKCRALFGCSEQQTTAYPAGSNWDDLESTLRGIITQVDDFRSRPRSSSPQEASEKIVQLLDATTSSVGEFEGLTSQRLAAVRGYTPTSWGLQLEDVFLSELWDDRCFRGLHPMVDAWALLPPGSPPQAVPSPTNRLAALYSKYGNPARLGHTVVVENFGFFARLANDMGVTLTNTELRCRGKPSMLKLRKSAEEGLKQRGPVVHFVVSNELRAWQEGWDHQKLVLHPLGLPRDQHVMLESRHTVSGGAWYLTNCEGLSCGEAVGMKLKKMFFKGARGPIVSEFRDTSNAMANLLYSLDEQFARDGSGSNVGIESRGMQDFMQVRDEFASWLAGFRGWVLQKRTETYFEHLVSSGKHRALKDIVEASPRVSQFFERKGWTFEPIHEEESGFAGQVLHMYGSPVMSRWHVRKLIRLVEHPNWDSIVHLRNAIRDTALDMLNHGIGKEWMVSQRGFWTRSNPFRAEMASDPVFEVCDHGDCAREGLARVVLVFTSTFD